jgi:hypothetical protein
VRNAASHVHACVPQASQEACAPSMAAAWLQRHCVDAHGAWAAPQPLWAACNHWPCRLSWDGVHSWALQVVGWSAFVGPITAHGSPPQVGCTSHVGPVQCLGHPVPSGGCRRAQPGHHPKGGPAMRAAPSSPPGAGASGAHGTQRCLLAIAWKHYPCCVLVAWQVRAVRACAPAAAASLCQHLVPLSQPRPPWAACSPAGPAWAPCTCTAVWQGGTVPASNRTVLVAGWNLAVQAGVRSLSCKHAAYTVADQALVAGPAC